MNAYPVVLRPRHHTRVAMQFFGNLSHVYDAWSDALGGYGFEEQTREHLTVELFETEAYVLTHLPQLNRARWRVTFEDGFGDDEARGAA